MRAKSLLGLFIVGLVALAGVFLKPRATKASEAAALPTPEKPWLSREAADQIIGPNSTLGPLFAGITLGGPAPSLAHRAQIAAFARKHDVSIKFEIVDDEVVAIRFDVTFGGCCGYEGVDALAARIGRPQNGGGCGMPKFYYDNWALATDDGTHVRGTVRVNHLALRWEQTLALDDIITRTEQALGADRGVLAKAAGDRWTTIESGRRYLLEAPYTYSSVGEWRPARAQAAARGILLATSQRIVTEASFTTDEDRARSRFKARWGRPRVNGETWTWHRSDRTIAAVFEYGKTTVTMSRR